MLETFFVTLFDASHDNDGSKEPLVFISSVSIVQLLAKQLVLFLLCHMSNCKILYAAQHCASLDSAFCNNLNSCKENIQTLFACTKKAA